MCSPPLSLFLNNVTVFALGHEECFWTFQRERPSLEVSVSCAYAFYFDLYDKMFGPPFLTLSVKRTDGNSDTTHMHIYILFVYMRVNVYSI